VLKPLGFPWNFKLEASIKIYQIWLRPDTNKGALHEHALESDSRI
jgi:hypothetical protein